MIKKLPSIVYNDPGNYLKAIGYIRIFSLVAAFQLDGSNHSSLEKVRDVTDHYGFEHKITLGFADAQFHEVTTRLVSEGLCFAEFTAFNGIYGLTFCFRNEDDALRFRLMF